MELIQVNQAKCVRCGLCAAVCPAEKINMGERGPESTGVRDCLACGHCVAVCPHGALDNVKTPLANQLPLIKSPILDADTATRFLRSRRSIRCYKQTAVPREKILQLLDIARFAPSGGNTQGIAYHVIDDPLTLRKITAAVVDWMEEQVQSGAPRAGYYAGVVANYRQTARDAILRNAPCLIVAAAPHTFMPRGRDNTHFSLAYAELYAPAIGLGTCYAGFFHIVASSGYQPLLELLGLPENMTVTGGLMLGYPRYSYQRLVDRNPLQVTWHQREGTVQDV